ncbi:hypothetical protein K435DRAFT_868105 [Dendrothele bispora CBS 962.96]|uniref:Uncharacterized protein n=1 Tax=Dendrothele bispora (strain CBS 962.96) TaxID=1314807 RepID=A0A4S8LCI4_DENBC|nr:hypothetical protein K435DRAFT_868105 [Dendrothele bispora CBS 962.96]
MQLDEARKRRIDDPFTLQEVMEVTEIVAKSISDYIKSEQLLPSLTKDGNEYEGKLVKLADGVKIIYDNLGVQHQEWSQRMQKQEGMLNSLAKATVQEEKLPNKSKPSVVINKMPENQKKLYVPPEQPKPRRLVRFEPPDSEIETDPDSDEEESGSRPFDSVKPLDIRPLQKRVEQTKQQPSQSVPKPKQNRKTDFILKTEDYVPGIVPCVHSIATFCLSYLGPMLILSDV